MQQAWNIRIYRASNIIQLSHTGYYYKSRRYDQTPLRKRSREIGYTRIRYGYSRIHIILRREGWQINKKRTYRLYYGTPNPVATPHINIIIEVKTKEEYELEQRLFVKCVLSSKK